MSETETAKARIITPVFRASFPHLFKAQESKKPGTEAKFGVMAIFSPATFSPEDRLLWEAMARLGNQAAMDRFKKTFREFPPTYKKPFHSAAEKISGEKSYGMIATDIYCNFTSKFKPQVVASDGKTIIQDIEGFYPGCYARASINAYSFSKDGGNGVAFGLFNVMFARHGERLDNRIEAEEDFGSYVTADSATGGAPLTDSDLGI